MQLIRCTQKLLKEINVRPTTNVEPIRSIMGGWHANLLRIERRKCILITNDSTLYTLFIPCLRKADFQNFHVVFGQHLFKNLLNEGFGQSQIEAVLDEHEQLLYDKTNNRSVLGSMNDQKIQLEWRIHLNGGLEETSIYNLNKELNRNILSAIDKSYPIEMLEDKLRNIT